MTRDVLNALAERCEAATRPDRELDEAIALATVEGIYHPKHAMEGSYAIRQRSAQSVWFTIPAYTASLDAAMTLVPEGLNRILGADNDGPFAQVGKPELATAFINAATEPLALCAAALRARAEQSA